MRTSLSVLLCLWAFNCILAPRLASDLVHSQIPTPKLAEFEAAVQQDMQKGIDGHNARDVHMQKFMRKTLEEHKRSRVEELPFNFQGLAMLESERFSSQVYEHHFNKLWDRLQDQDQAVTKGGILAPLLAVRTASMAFAGTDFAHHRHFATAAEKHRFQFVRVLNEDLMNNAKPGDSQYMAGRKLWETLEEFRLEPFPLSSVWTVARTGVLVLAGWLAAALLFLVYSAGRLRVMSS